MISSSLPPHCWAEVMYVSTYLTNIHPSIFQQGGIPLERISSHSRVYSALCLFGHSPN
jgi:hypothetical protein